MGSNFPPREVSTMKGNFQKQRHDELSHWNEWKHWVHGRAVESHDFEDKKMGRWARLGDRMMMMTDKMISDWCQNCDEIQMFAIICCSVLWTFRLPRIVRCFRVFFSDDHHHLPTSTFLAKSLYSYSIKLNYGQMPTKLFSKGILRTPSQSGQELCTMFTNTEFLSFIYRALGTKIGRRVQIDQRLGFRGEHGETSLGGGIYFLGFLGFKWF